MTDSDTLCVDGNVVGRDVENGAAKNISEIPTVTPAAAPEIVLIVGQVIIRLSSLETIDDDDPTLPGIPPGCDIGQEVDVAREVLAVPVPIYEVFDEAEGQK